ncbi:MAG: hypothetical protein LBJ15_16315 [Comamonas sp.]|jgi:hypothetical protein|uniref:hypothetical protein n=1 Tax=Comamonas sp. TaxID=34028 RepID=UPI0028229120|nr:hypothetical protein [Comamonas sp.]MDR0215547.1 hypothetical protein [Comamonas sp.]
MPVIHAYRRKEATTVELFGISIEFKQNEKKDFVADVTHEGAAERLLGIPEAYREYGVAVVHQAILEASVTAAAAIPASEQSSATAAPEPGVTQARAEAQYVFTNEAGDSIDISAWTAKEIRDFAEANQIDLPKGNGVKVGELRDMLAAALRAGEVE